MSEICSTCADGDAGPLAYNSADAARLIGVSPKTLLNWRYEGKGPTPIRVSRSLVLYRRDALEDWLHDMQRRGGAA